jgi:hypothetical protein
LKFDIKKTETPPEINEQNNKPSHANLERAKEKATTTMEK